jgi:hypothetical protein
LERRGAERRGVAKHERGGKEISKERSAREGTARNECEEGFKKVFKTRAVE